MSKWLPWAFFASVGFFLVTIFFHTVIEFDQDLGRHLLMGKIIVSGLAVPKINLLSHTYPNFPFINSHWLSEVVFYLVNQVGGAGMLLGLKVVVMTAAFSLTTLTAWKFSRSLVATAMAFLVMAPVLLERTEIRPEMFSYLFTAIFVYILLLNQKRWWWILPILEIFWVNMHIYFILGPILVAIFGVQVVWSKRLERNWLLLIGGLTIIATLLNPFGFLGAIYPFTVFENYGYSIVENQNIFFLETVTRNPNIAYFKFALVCLGGSFILSRFWKRPLVIFLLTGLVILPMVAIRSFPYFYLLLMPVMALNLSDLQPRILEVIKKWAHLDWLVIFGICLIIFWQGWQVVSGSHYRRTNSQKEFGFGVSESGRTAADFFLVEKLHGPVFNNFDLGSYLEYRLYPDEKMFVDGRPEAFPANFFQNLYIPMQMNQEDFDRVDALYGFNVIFFAHTDGTPWAEKFLSFIQNDARFVLVYLDPYAAIWVKKGVFPEVEQKFAVRPESLISQGKNLRETIYLARVAQLFGWGKVSERLQERAAAFLVGR